MVTRDEQDFLDSIIARPEDLFLRMVYADWLEEQGRRDEALVIRMQCDPEHYNEAEFFEDDEPDLVQSVTALSPLAKKLKAQGAENIVFRNGMPASITIPLTSLIENRVAQTGIAPIEELHISYYGPLSSGYPDIAALKRNPLVQKAKILDLGQCHFNEEKLQEFVMGEKLPNVTHFKAPITMSNQALNHLLHNQVLPGLHHLDCDYCAFLTDNCMQEIAQHPLTTISLSGTAITDEGAYILAQSPHINNYRSIQLVDSFQWGEGYDALCHVAGAGVIKGARPYVEVGEANVYSPHSRRGLS